MIQNNYFNDNPDLFHQFEDIVDWEEIVKAYENDFGDAKRYKETGDEKLAYAPNNVEEAREYYRTILEAYGDLSGNEVAPIAAELDQAGGVKFKDGEVIYPDAMVNAVNKFYEAGLGPLAFAREWGGLGLPFTVRAMISEVMNRADIAIATQIGSTSVADIIERYGSEEAKERWLPDVTANKYFCAMGLSEPDYGSDLPSVNTRAELKEDGKWYLNGTKRFITIGCGMRETPSLILTLARTGGQGARGLSFFIVKSTDLTVGNVEKKLGLKSSPTCELVFEDAPGELVGEKGFGLIKYVMGMLDGARMNIAAQSTGLATACWEEAKSFASSRIQFGKTLETIPAVARMLEKMEREILAMRCLTLEGARTVDLYEWRARRQDAGEKLSAEEAAERKFWQKIAGLMTPLSKYYNSEMCNRIAYDALQIHGGSGFTEDYDIARLYRDARITTIYDGTTQIQVNAAIGGVVSGMSATGTLRKYLDSQFDSFSGELTFSAELKELYDIFEKVVAEFKETIKGEDKDRMSFEVVEACARLVNGLLLEKTAYRLSGEAREERLSIAQDYNIDSVGILNQNLYQLKARAKKATVAAR